MNLEFLGTGNAFSKTKGPSCAILRTSVGKDILIDAGECVNKLVIEAMNAKRILQNNDNSLAIFLTHMHPDHIAGLGTLIYELYFEKGFKYFHIYVGHESHREFIKELLQIFSISENDKSRFTVSIQVWQSNSGNDLLLTHEEKMKEDGSKEVTCTYLNMFEVPHDPRKRCHGLRILETVHSEKITEDGRGMDIKKISKRAIIYSGDTSSFAGDNITLLDDNLYESLHDLDYLTIVHEATMYIPDDGIDSIHINIRRLLTMLSVFDSCYFRQTEKNYVLYHLPDEIEYIDQLRSYGDVDQLDISIVEKGELI